MSRNVRFNIAPEILVRAEALERPPPFSSDRPNVDNATNNSNNNNNNTYNKDGELPEALSFGGSVPFSLTTATPSIWNEIPCPVVCYHDGELFDTKPLSMPLSFNAKTKMFGVWGVFCSPGCMKRYARDRAGLPLPKNKILGLMKLMFVMVYKIRDRIIANPPREMLKQYNIDGKGFTIAEFRQQGTLGVHIEFVPDCFFFAPVAVCTQKILSPEEISARLAQVEILDKIKSRRIAHPPRPTGTLPKLDLTNFYPSSSADEESAGGGTLGCIKEEGKQMCSDHQFENEEEEQENDEDNDDDDDEDDVVLKQT